jgi:phosphomannomutase
MTRAPSVLTALAQAWIAGDPEPATRAELSELLAAGNFHELEQRLQPLAFGTAGLRGAVGAGSGRMNLAVVTRAAYGVARYLEQTPAASGRPIVIGFDARPTSRVFAEVSAGVLSAAGFEVVAFTRACATPLCAFLGRELGAAATIVVTASHNPRGDNGYKVYGPDAVQIVSPTDVEIARQIELSPPAKDVPTLRVRFDAPAVGDLKFVDPAELVSYFQALSRAIPAGLAQREPA